MNNESFIGDGGANQYLTCSVDEEEATGKEENPIKVYQVSFTRGHLK